MTEHQFTYYGAFPCQVLVAGKPVPKCDVRWDGHKAWVKCNSPETVQFVHVPVPRTQLERAREDNTINW